MTVVQPPIQRTPRRRPLARAVCLAVVAAAAACGDAAPGADATPTGAAFDLPTTSLDTGATVPDVPRVSVLDGSGSDSATAVCPGGPGCACAQHAECQTGLCIDDPASTGPANPGGKACARTCVDTCPIGYACAPVTGSGGDISTVCVPKYGKLCDPCATSKDCEALGLKDSACVQQGALGRFCGVACVAKADCPVDYECQKVLTVEGGTLQQCVRPGTAGTAFGVCPCSAAAVQKKLATACYTEVKDASGKVIGQCAGSRACEATGLSACTAPAALPEACNGKDDDCDGQTDEAACDDTNPCTEDLCDPAKANCTHKNQTGAACDADGNACTVGDACQDGKCAPGKPKDCDDKNPCTADTCDLAKGCTQVHDDGKPCDADGSLCTQGDVCLAGACKQGAPTGCDDGNPCTIDGCDKKSGQCTGAALDDGVPCDDGTLCTDKDACKGGTCKGKPVVCEDNNPCTADVCDAKAGCQLKNLSGAACEDDNVCTAGDVCGDGQCKQGIAKVCTDGNGCTVDTCEAKAGCKFSPGAGACDDGNACTAGDGCAGGACAGKVVGCDDGDPCTKDACEPGKGCLAVAVAEKADCSADGGKWCLGGKCVGKLTTCSISFEKAGVHLGLKLPVDVTGIEVLVWGGGGGSTLDTTDAKLGLGKGGAGAHVAGFVALPQAAVVLAHVAGGGQGVKYPGKAPVYRAPGGGGAPGQGSSNHYGAGGGGLSGVMINGKFVTVAGGGGGGTSDHLGFALHGGAAGVAVGAAGQEEKANFGGKGGSQASGGEAGIGGGGCGLAGDSGPGLPGGYLAGGDAGPGGGGGGGGLWGGGGGGATGCLAHGAGGGGSSLVPAGGVGLASNQDVVPASNKPEYIAGHGHGGQAGSDGGSGLVVVKWQQTGACAAPTLAFASCASILASLPDAVSGLYPIDPDGPGPIAPANLFCDMKNGGWTLVGNYYDSPGDDMPNSTDHVVSGWQQTASGKWDAKTSVVDRAWGGGTGSAAVSLTFVEALGKAAGQKHLKMCFVHKDGYDTACRSSFDGSMTLVSYDTGNPKLTAYKADKLTYTFGRLGGLAGSADGYDPKAYGPLASPVYVAAGIAGEFGIYADKSGLHDHSDGTYAGVWHGNGCGQSFQPWNSGNQELGVGTAGACPPLVAEGPDTVPAAFGFRLYIGPAPTLGSQAQPATSCKAILDAKASLGDGAYWLDPDGPGGVAVFQAYCDMTTDGGGWTVFMVASAANSKPNVTKTLLDPTGAAGYGYMPNQNFAALFGPGKRVRGWSRLTRELYVECDWQSAGTNHKDWTANANCVLRVAKKAGGFAVLPIPGPTGKGAGFTLQAAPYDTVNPRNPLTDNSVFTKDDVNAYSFGWALPGWSNPDETDTTYQYYWGQWTTDAAKAMVYALR